MAETTWTPIDDPTAFQDDVVFEIDKTTKTIQVIVEQPIVAGENKSQFIKFQMGRYYDAIDLTQMEVNILYESPTGYQDINSAVNREYSDEYIRFGWLVPYPACPVKGTLSFAVEFVGADYVLKTTRGSTPVLDSIPGSSAAPEPTEKTWYIELQSQVATTLQAASDALEKSQQIVNALATPQSATLASEMSETSAVYVYIGESASATDDYEALVYGHWYYYDSTAEKWRDGGEYVSTDYIIDSTLTQSGEAADAKAVGDKFDNIEGSLNDTNADVYSGQAMSASATSNGWRLNDSNGLVTANSSYKIVKYQVTAGERVKVISDDKFQFQTVASVPSSGSSNRLGVTYSAGTYYLTVPATATYLICSALISSGVADAYALSPKVDILGEQIGGINANVDNIKNVLDTQTIEPVNKIDPDKLTTGRYLYDGTFESNSSYKTTDYIAVNTGDVIAFYKKISAAINVQRETGERLALFDVNKTYLGVSGQYPVKTDVYYTVENASAKYIRLSYSAALTEVELTINQTVNEFSEYVPATLDSIRLAKIERNIGITTSSKIIDCWGDSRTDMSDDGTSYCDYLQTLLGGTWIVQNRGISGQASGQVAARFGSNEVFLTLENNQVPVSGSALITAWKVSTGTDTNLRGGDSTYGVHGILNGVPGKYIHTTGGNINFVRDYDGVAVKVKPRTKLIPDPYFNAEHCQILWCGKNDFSYAYPNVVGGIEGNYDGMVAKIPHDKFIILGETNGIGDTYLPGHSNRDYVDSINTYLAQKYPDNFIDIQAELIADGLTLEGITPTSADTSNIANGWIPDSLMADETHPNQYGREAIAKIIYAWMQEKEWV